MENEKKEPILFGKKWSQLFLYDTGPLEVIELICRSFNKNDIRYLPGWTRGWVLHRNNQPIRLKRQQSRGKVMFRISIVSSNFMSFFKIEDDAKINADNIVDF